MMVGRAYIRFDGVAQSVSLGTVISITPTLNKRSVVTPIPSLDMQSAFPIETGNSKSYSLTFKRVNPPVPNDSGSSDEWSNEKWYEVLTDCINRWQARTDGCTLDYVANDNVYLPNFSERGYIKSITRTYSNDFNEVISGTLQFTVGRMHVRTDTIKDPDRAYTDLQSMYVMISDPDETNWYTILYGNDPSLDTYNLVNSISITGGPESPFEYATLTISKRKLMEQVPELYDERNGGTQIFATKNKLILDVMSATDQPRRMLVTKVRSSGNNITITAYTEAWRYHNVMLRSQMTGSPDKILESILTDSFNGVVYDKSRIITSFETPTSFISIQAGVSVWRALQDCAICMGCRIWFADGCVFVVDLRRRVGNDRSRYSTYVSSVPLFELNGKYCIGTVTVDEEGIDPVANSVLVQCTSSTGVQTDCYAQVDESIDNYGEISAGRLSIPELVQHVSNSTDAAEYPIDSGNMFARNYISYLCEPQRSITFTFKELYYINGRRRWQSYFGAISQVDRIIDSYDKETITNDSSIHPGRQAYHKLAMSSYTRRYPQCTCEYSFGVIANIDLSSSTSQINNALSSR